MYCYVPPSQGESGGRYRYGVVVTESQHLKSVSIL